MRSSHLENKTKMCRKLQKYKLRSRVLLVHRIVEIISLPKIQQVLPRTNLSRFIFRISIFLTLIRRKEHQTKLTFIVHVHKTFSWTKSTSPLSLRVIGTHGSTRANQLYILVCISSRRHFSWKTFRWSNSLRQCTLKLKCASLLTNFKSSKCCSCTITLFLLFSN